MPSESERELDVEIETLTAPMHAVDANKEAARRLVTEIRTRYRSISETLPQMGRYAAGFVREQTALMQLPLQSYRQYVILQGEAIAIRINAERSAEHPHDLIDLSRERALANEFADRVANLIKRMEVHFLQRAEQVAASL